MPRGKAVSNKCSLTKSGGIIFAKNFREWGIQEWRKVLWIDERTSFESDGSDKYVWLQDGSDLVNPLVMASTVIHFSYLVVLGALGYGGVADFSILSRGEAVNKEPCYLIPNP